MHHESAPPQKAASGLVELFQANISRRFLRGNGGFFYLDKPSRQGQKKTQKGEGNVKKRIS
jgi:hypothetical protein